LSNRNSTIDFGSKKQQSKKKKPTEKQQKIFETDNTPETMLGCRQ